jgi:RimJ/RimL family protein N-acetyltransferase
MTSTAVRVIATGDLVRLREKRVEDAERDYEWRRDPELAAYDAAKPLTMSLPSFTATIAEELRYPQSHRRTFAIEELSNGRHIGNVMYYGYDSTQREAELGITIGDRDYWSQGYGADAVTSMLRHLFGELDLRRVFLHTLTWNHRAQQCFLRAGFRRVREVTRGPHDFVLMEAFPGSAEGAID